MFKGKKILLKRIKNPIAISLFVILIAYSITIFFVIGWGFLTSLKSISDFGYPGFNAVGLPDLGTGTSNSREEFFKFKNYAVILDELHYRKSLYYPSAWFNVEFEHSCDTNFWGMIVNTLLISIGGAIIQAIIPCLMGYACAKYKYKFSEIVYGVVVVVMMIPIVGGYPSMIVLFKNLGIYDTFFGYYFQVASFTGMYFLVFYAFFEGLSDVYKEAAEIDGASQLHILLFIMLPLAKTLIGTVMLIRGVAIWNDYQTPLLYLPTKPTLAFIVYDLSVSNGTAELSYVPRRMAACFMLCLPILVLFILMRDRLMGNLTLGGVKE